MRSAFVIAALVACGGGGSKDWSERKLVTSNETIGAVKFSIELPEGMAKKADHGQLHWDFREDGRVKTPDVDVSDKAAFKSLEDYVTFAHVKEFVRKDKLPDGFIVAHENPSFPGKQDYIVYAMRGPVGCMLRVTRWSKDDDVKAKLPIAEKFCESIKYQ
jgi:hypothetical protein